ncbi:MAG: hypothetical protein KF893_09810 [Caldilineaceae bacterium]|nr:hypothetical protein [Caldilineaceae bacterium]
MNTRTHQDQSFPVIDLLMPGQVKGLNNARPIPVLDLPLADGRKWCQATLEWLDGVRICTCPTNDLLAEGICRRSPRGGKCLLLLPGDHPDWRPARRHRFDPQRQMIALRQTPAPPPPQPPLALEEMERGGAGSKR